MVGQRSWPFEPNRWYRIKVKYGESIEVWLVDSSARTLLVNYADTAPVYTDGKTGFTMWAGSLCDSEVWFDNVEVTSLSQTKP